MPSHVEIFARFPKIRSHVRFIDSVLEDSGLVVEGFVSGSCGLGIVSRILRILGVDSMRDTDRRLPPDAASMYETCVRGRRRWMCKLRI